VTTSDLAKCVDFYNGKGIRPLKSGKYPVYGSNGILGFTNEFLYENAIVLGRVGAYCGSVQIEKDKFWPSDNTIVLQPKDHIDIDYLYYYLKSLDLNRVSGGSAQPLITHTSLAKVQIEVPLKDVQTNNSGVLKIIDTLIEHHKLINSNLEAIFMLTFERWFHQFDFPNKQGEPYKASGGEMIWNDRLNREIPKSWNVVSLGEVVTKNSIKVSKPKDSDVSTIDLSVMPKGSFCLDSLNVSGNFTTNLFELREFDLLFGGIRPYLRKSGFSPVDGYVTGTVYSFKPNKIEWLNFLIGSISHESIFNFAIANSKGTKMPVIGIDELFSYPLAYDPEVIVNFQDSLSFVEDISSHIHAIQNLINLKNSLMPQIMAGNIGIQ